MQERGAPRSCIFVVVLPILPMQVLFGLHNRRQATLEQRESAQSEFPSSFASDRQKPLHLRQLPRPQFASRNGRVPPVRAPHPIHLEVSPVSLLISVSAVCDDRQPKACPVDHTPSRQIHCLVLDRAHRSHADSVHFASARLPHENRPVRVDPRQGEPKYLLLHIRLHRDYRCVLHLWPGQCKNAKSRPSLILASLDTKLS